MPTTALGEVRQPKYPANLLELGYHDNYADAAWVENNMDAIARELARSLTEYFGLPFIEPQPVVQGTVSTSGSPLRLRAYPSAAGQTIALMPNGASVTVYGAWQGWNTVEYNGNLGYAARGVYRELTGSRECRFLTGRCGNAPQERPSGNRSRPDRFRKNKHTAPEDPVEI